MDTTQLTLSLFALVAVAVICAIAIKWLRDIEKR